MYGTTRMKVVVCHRCKTKKSVYWGNYQVLWIIRLGIRFKRYLCDECMVLWLKGI